MTIPLDIPPALITQITAIVTKRSGKPERGEIRFSCPLPANHENGDRHPSARWSPERAVWRCDVCHEGGGAFDLAERLGIDWQPAAPRLVLNGNGNHEPATLAAWAASRHLPLAMLERAFDCVECTHQGRPAIRFLTDAGDRIRYLDGQKPKTNWARSGSQTLYPLTRAVRALKRGQDRLYLVNGEPSVWSCAAHGIAAICLCTGEMAPNEANVALLAEALATVDHPIAVCVVYDLDRAGVRAAGEAVAALRAGGLTAIALELPSDLGPSGDVDDLHRRIGAGLAAALADLPELAPAADDARLSADDFYAYMPEHKYLFVPGRDLWPAVSVNARVGRGAAKWLDANRAVEQMTWAPGEPLLIEGQLLQDGGWVQHADVRTFNLYRAPTIMPGSRWRAERWVDHVHMLYPAEAEHIIDWLAQRVQHPAVKINHALVLGGSQGIGKDTLLDPVRYAVGPWNVREISPSQLLGDFNEFARTVILRVSEARDLGEINRFAFYEHMKSYTASPPDVLRCNEKNLRAYSVLNVCGVVMTTNHQAAGIYLPPDDRRHFVAWSDALAADFGEDYWNEIYGWYAAGGYEHVTAYLAEHNLSRFDPKAPPPKTTAFWAIVDANRAPEDAELSQALDTLGWPDATTIEQVSCKSDLDFAAWLRDRKNRRQIPHRMESASYVPVRNEAAADGLWKIAGRRQVVYARRDMSSRDRIAAVGKLT